MPSSRSRYFERLGEDYLAGSQSGFSLDGQIALPGSGGTIGSGGGTTVDIGGGEVEPGGGMEAGGQRAPVLTGIPGIAQFVSVGRPAALADIVVSYPDDTELTVTLEVLDGFKHVGGTFGELVDRDEGRPGLQLKGTAAEISAALADATFTADDVGQGHLKITATDGNKTATSHYAFTAVAAPVNSAPTFAVPTGTGKLVLPDDNFFSTAFSVALQPDGKIVVAGSSTKDGKSDFSLARLNFDGSLDGDFGRDGQLLVDIDGLNDSGQSVIVQPDGKIVVAGYTIPGRNPSFSLIRLDGNGNLDMGFGDEGTKLLEVGNGIAMGQSVILQPDGKIVVAGKGSQGSDRAFSLVRLDANGSLDKDFGIDGKLLLDVGGGEDNAQSVTLQPDGKIVVAGYSGEGSNFDFSLIRLHSDGSPDTDFGAGGKKLLDLNNGSDYGRSVILQPDGKIVVAGYSLNGSNYDFSLIRLDAHGDLDWDFGHEGRVLLDIGGYDDRGQSVTLQPDGKIVVAGYSKSGSDNFDFSLIRLNADGSPDTDFGAGGKKLLDLDNRDDYGQSVILQPDGKIVVAGYSTNESGGNDFSLIRLNADGSLDTTFNPSTDPVDTLGGAASYTESGLPVVLDDTVEVFDAELAAQGHYAGASLTLARSGGAHAQDVFGASGALVLTADGGVELSGTRIGSYSRAEGQLTLSFNAQATQARVNQALSLLTYANTSDAPPGGVTIDWSFYDGSGDMPPASGSTQVNITPVNAQPPAPQPPAPQPPAPPPAPPVPPPATPGIDMVHYAGVRGDYVLERDDAAVWGISTISGSSATPLPGIERLVFDDGAVALDVAVQGPDASAAQAARLVFALWGRAGLDNPDLVGHVMAYVDALGLGAASQVAENLGLLTALAGDAEPAALLTLLYTHIVGRAPDAAELQVLLELPASGLSNAQLVQIAAELAVTAQAMDLDALAQQGLEFTPYEGLVFGSNGNEVLRAQQGDDRIDAGAGVDTVVYAGKAADYVWRSEEQGQWIVKSTVHDGGRDALERVERLQFADHAVALDLDGAAGQALRMLGAARGAHALDDRALVGELIAFVDAHGVQALADSVQANGILDQLAGGDSMQSLISLLYRNLTQHTPDEAQTQEIMELAEQQNWDRADLLVHAAELPQTAQTIGLEALTAQGVAYEVWGA